MERKIALISFALLLLCALPFAACTPGAGAHGCTYDQPCSSSADCTAPLICQSFSSPYGSATATVSKCTQPVGICTNLPENAPEAVPPAVNGQSPGGPLTAIGNLEAGSNGAISSGSNLYNAGWFSDWNKNGLIGVAIVISIIAIAAMFGYGFNLPEVKAFVDAELVQAVVSVLLIVSLIALVGFFDDVARIAMTSQQLPVSCNANEPCYITAAKSYLTTLNNTADSYARNALSESIERQKTASMGVSTQMNFWFLLFFGTNLRPNAYMSLQAERAGTVFETVTKLMGSLYAQAYFIDVISFGIAPIFLLLGIVLRTFFFTRKLGGLLLAIAVALFFVYPLTYAFAWYTLNVTVYGERTLASASPTCPSECTAAYPVAFYIDSAGGIKKFESTQQLTTAGIINDTAWAAAGAPGGAYPGLYACRDLTSLGIDQGLTPVYNGVNLGALSVSGTRLTDSGRTGADAWKENEFKGNKLVLNGNSAMKYNITKNGANYIEVGLPAGSSLPAATSYQVIGSCGGCPDYCREVPFPSSLPGCDIKKCSTCNAGCKIMRQRTDCASAAYGSCGSCDASCKMNLSTENKCSVTYSTSDAPGGGAQAVVAAQLGGTCEGCGGCPNWCRVLKYSSATGTYSKYYNDAACDIPACLPPNLQTSTSVPGTCSLSCFYSTQLTAGSCDQMCTGPSGVMCPKYCRVKGLGTATTNGYDVTNPTVAAKCSDSLVQAACNVCPDTCKVNVDDANPKLNAGLSCAPYPEVPQTSGECTDCPLYCRYDAYSFITDRKDAGGAQLSSVAITSAGVPASCTTGIEGRLACASTGSPAACDATCKASATSVPSYPPLCRAYSATAGDYLYCQHCSEAGRVVLSHENSAGITQTVRPAFAAKEGSSDSGGTFCSEANCAGACLAPVAVPGEKTLGSCANKPNNNYDCAQHNNDYPSCISHAAACDWKASCTDTDTSRPGTCGSSCPVECRIKGSPYALDAKCSLCGPAFCADACKADLGAASGYTCSEYLGNGKAEGTCSGSGAGCSSKTDPSSCRKTQNCQWNGVGYCTAGESIDCQNYITRDDCLDVGPPPHKHNYTCQFVYYGDASVPIVARADPYNDVSSCKQCPENCRVDGYSGTCGAGGAPGENVDCSATACPSVCRTTIKVSTDPGGLAICKAPAPDFGLACAGCPALCRRPNGELAPDPICSTPACGAYNPQTGLGCTDQCKLTAPSKLCTACFDCPNDCLYQPAVRTDCAEVCTNEDLAGPISIGQDDFIKKLPGAQGASDVKNAGTLMIPALVLPLFSIVITLAFIRVFSPLFGGDIEIPGLSRII
ncbi:Uncharacterised protein [uncultured archaeon]|nr:Uncharacterised protein [uncultured archaeon]